MIQSFSDKIERGINLTLGRNTDRTSGTHDNFQPFRKQAAQSGPCNSCLMGAADMHERQIPVYQFDGVCLQFLFPSPYNLKSIYREMT